MKIVVIADTHGYHQLLTIPAADVLLVAGDICSYGSLTDIEEFSTWLLNQPCEHKIVIAGNHDAPFQSNKSAAAQALTRGDSGITYLQDSSVKIGETVFYGSPWIPTFMNWYFMADRGAVIRRKWAMIPDNTDVLITHGPPATILDYVREVPQGCGDLLQRIFQVKPVFSVFGHIHEGYGRIRRGGVTFINASICDGRYMPSNKPVVFNL